ncbi:IS3 family transposase [Paraburkholderia panacisoli]|uniref:IS3 family transposase n=1 Tax=Paraburkholderia panacisoli TaxID=2603818 RepID=A0A5B0GGM7_9BURK|nr:IS3 family transposase [Paraburkholderia panacisoli]
MVYLRRFKTREQAKCAVSEYIELLYNRQRTQVHPRLSVACGIYAAIQSKSARCLTGWHLRFSTDLSRCSFPNNENLIELCVDPLAVIFRVEYLNRSL